MDKIDVVKNYHDRICSIWDKVKKTPELKDICKKGAFVQDTLYKNSLLFLGVGASDPEDKKGKNKKNSCLIKDEVQYETEEGRNDYDYYQPMIKLAKATGFEHWSNIDITLFRETSQKALKPYFNKCSGIMQEQFELAKTMIMDVEPKIIVASNAFVRDVLHYFTDKPTVVNFDTGFCFKFNDAYGTPVINNPLKDTPVFFCSMLSGAGALDKGSYERLVWHINYVISRKT